MPASHAVVPVALGGDSLAGNGVAVGAVALVSMVLGYLLLAGLWYFVFRRSPAEREAERRAERERAELIRRWRPATGAPRDPDPDAAPAAAPGHPQRLHIKRPLGPPFRRR